MEHALKEKDNIIYNWKNDLKTENNNIKKLNEKLNKIISESNQKIKEKENIIKQYKLKISQFPFEILPGEKIMTITFVSFDQNIISSFICKNTDIFNILENKFYEKYPEFKDLVNNFLSNGRNINKNKSLDENNIKNNDIITILD